jgi:dipeptidyl aminopeptidase/acylaminoacyl peptidase
MTSPRRFEQDLPALLAGVYLAGTPDYRDDLVQQVARVRQRPAWTFPERWLPMDLATKAVPGAPRVPWRIVGVLALLAALLATMLALYVGSERRAPAEPFGPAANGVIAYVEGGGIYTADPETGKATPVVVGPDTDTAPTWSPDGTRFVFERRVKDTGGAGLLFVANADGRGLVQITPEPQFGLSEWSFSPDGRSIVAFVGGGPAMPIMVLPSDGSGQAKTFDVGATPNDAPPQYRADGSEIMFIGLHPGTEYRDLYGLDPVSGDVRVIVAGSTKADIHAASWSPDGTRIAYATHDLNSEGISTRTHVVAADGTGDILVDAHPDSIADAGTTWSNDGTRLIITLFYPGAGPNGLAQSAIVPIDRSSVGVEMECPASAHSTDCTADLVWAPDDSVIIASRLDQFDRPTQQFLVDPTTGKIRPAPWKATGHPEMQRRAP